MDVGHDEEPAEKPQKKGRRGFSGKDAAALRTKIRGFKRHLQSKGGKHIMAFAEAVLDAGVMNSPELRHWVKEAREQDRVAREASLEEIEELKARLRDQVERNERFGAAAH